MMIEKGKLMRAKKPTDYCNFNCILLDLFKDSFGCMMLILDAWCET